MIESLVKGESFLFKEKYTISDEVFYKEKIGVLVDNTEIWTRQVTNWWRFSSEKLKDFKLKVENGEYILLGYKELLGDNYIKVFGGNNE